MTNYFFEWNLLPHLCDKVIKKALVERNIGKVSDAITFGEDAACVFPCMLEAESIAIMDAAPYHYRQREGSVVNELKELKHDNFIGLYQVLGKAFSTEPLLQKQLKYYMFFTLLLKAYSELTNYMPLFPFEKVKRGSRVLVYGAGGFGRIIEKYVRNSQHLKLVGWADKNAVYYQKCGLSVVSLDKIVLKQFDYIVIAILNENIAEKVREQLEEMGINLEKVDFVQKNVLDKYLLPIWLQNTYK